MRMFAVVTASRVECDEIWSFAYAKQKNVGALGEPGPTHHGRAQGVSGSG